MRRSLREARIASAVAKRARARAAGDFARADALREALRRSFVEVNDRADGTAWFAFDYVGLPDELADIYARLGR